MRATCYHLIKTPMSLAPIVLFVYNRPWHTQQTVEALLNNDLANESDLFIYSDAAKNDTTVVAVENVRDYLKQIIGFKNITIIERDKNWGLADSIIDGVTTLINQYGKIIVLEDDLITSPYFLKYMNDALTLYKDENRVKHISAYNLPISTKNLSETFFYRASSCWGWATWNDRWSFFEKDTDNLLKLFTLRDIYHFNLNGSNDFWGHIIANKQKKINTWAIFWYATIFLEQGLCLHPAVSLVSNVGHDGSGIHCGKIKHFDVQLAQQPVNEFTTVIEEDKLALGEIMGFYKSSNKIILLQLKMLKSCLFGKLYAMSFM